MNCKHCGKPVGSRVSRGLCWGCSLKPELRELYPSTSKHARRGVGIVGNADAPLPTFATHAEPGSEEKIALMAERARLKQSVFHPDDVRIVSELIPFWDLPTQRRSDYEKKSYRDLRDAG